MYFLIGFCTLSAIVSLVVRSLSPAIGRQTAICAAVIASASLVGELSGVFEEIKTLTALGGMGSETVKNIFKAVGIAYLARIASSVCNDAGESALAETAELSGRIALVLMALPIVRRIAEALIGLLNTPS